MEKEVRELSGAVITANGALLPGNFEKLSTSKQKQIIVGALQDSQMTIMQNLDELKEIQIQAKQLKQKLSMSREAKELKRLTEAIKRINQFVELSLVERNGMHRMAKALGFDVTNEIKQMKQINS